MSKYYNAIIMISLVFFFINCDNEAVEEEKNVIVQKEHLEGHWEVIKAKRDNKPTKLLDNTTFYFGSDSMESNLPTQENKAAYSWSEDEIIRQAGDITTYTVHSLNKDSLEFSVDLQGFNFDMSLLKIKKDNFN